MKKIVCAVAAAGLTFGLGACSQQNGPEKAVTTFGDAVKEKDYKTVCDTLDPEIVDQLEQVQPGKDCADIFKENEDAFAQDIPEDAEVDIQDSKIAEDEKTATVTVKDKDGKEQDIKLVNVDDEWKVTFEQ